MEVQQHKLLKVRDYSEIMACLYQIEDSTQYVLELLCFGSAYSSYYLLLRSLHFLSHLDDERVKSRLLSKPYLYGKKLLLNKHLYFNENRQDIYYISPSV